MNTLVDYKIISIPNQPKKESYEEMIRIGINKHNETYPNFKITRKDFDFYKNVNVEDPGEKTPTPDQSTKVQIFLGMLNKPPSEINGPGFEKHILGLAGEVLDQVTPQIFSSSTKAHSSLTPYSSDLGLPDPPPESTLSPKKARTQTLSLSSSPTSLTTSNQTRVHSFQIDQGTQRISEGFKAPDATQKARAIEMTYCKEIREVGGDGACYYRAVIFGSIINLLRQGNRVKASDILNKLVTGTNDHFISRGRSREVPSYIERVADLRDRLLDSKYTEDNFIDEMNRTESAWALIMLAKYTAANYLIRHKEEKVEGFDMSLKDVQRVLRSTLEDYVNVTILQKFAYAEGALVDHPTFFNALGIRSRIFTISSKSAECEFLDKYPDSDLHPPDVMILLKNTAIQHYQILIEHDPKSQFDNLGKRVQALLSDSLRNDPISNIIEMANSYNYVGISEVIEAFQKKQKPDSDAKIEEMLVEARNQGFPEFVKADGKDPNKSVIYSIEADNLSTALSLIEEAPDM